MCIYRVLCDRAGQDGYKGLSHDYGTGVGLIGVNVFMFNLGKNT